MNDQMNDQMLTGILVLLVPLVIGEIRANDKITEVEATRRFYGSKVYAVLGNEKTKLWHLSPKTLYGLYRQEQDTGKIEFPEEA